MNRYLLFGLFFVALGPLSAGTIDVTANSLVTLHHGGSLIFEAGAWNYGPQAASYGLTSLYPGEISIMLGGLPVAGPVAPIPGTSSVYTTGALFSGTLESLDGSIVIPLVDPNAARLGLPNGDLLLGPGSRSGGSYTGPTSILLASAVVSSAEAAALFASDTFVLRIRDLGGDITFGFPGAPITSALSASLISPGGTLSVGAIPLRAQMPTPEPATAALLLIGLAVIAGRWGRRPNQSRYARVPQALNE